MSSPLLTLIFLCAFILSGNVFSNEFKAVTVSASATQVKVYKEILDGLEPYEFNNYKHPKMDRAIADHFLMSKALHLGGYRHKFDYVDSPNYARSLSNLSNGKSALMNQSVWLEDVSEEEVYISGAVIENGWFQKGVYVLPDRTDLLNIVSVEELRRYKTISSSNWVKDWQEINRLGLNPFNISLDTQMFKMLKGGRIDYLFLYFSKREDLVSHIPGYKVVPVKGMKLLLYGTRHFAVSKKHEDSNEIFVAITKGLEILKQSGAIEKAMVDTGFINPQVKDWTVMNPQ